MLNALGFLFHNVSAGLPPSAEPTCDVGNWLETHALYGLGRESGTQTSGAEKYELLTRSEDLFVIRAFRVDPEF